MSHENIAFFRVKGCESLLLTGPNYEYMILLSIDTFAFWPIH